MFHSAVDLLRQHIMAHKASAQGSLQVREQRDDMMRKKAGKMRDENEIKVVWCSLDSKVVSRRVYSVQTL